MLSYTGVVLQLNKDPSHLHPLKELSGAFADLGTFLPIVIAVLTLQKVDPTGLFYGFGIFALTVAAVYRRPIPVQPMKMVAAIVITQNLDAQTIAATGFLLGLVVAALSLSGTIDKLARNIPAPVLSGIQLGIGLLLAWAGVGLISEAPWIGAVATSLLLLLLITPLKPFAAILIVAGAITWTLATKTDPLETLRFGLHWPQWSSFSWQQLGFSAHAILLPQLSLTLTNAIIATAAIASHYFPQDKQRITPTKLGLTTGIMNMLLAPLGGFPMCHGAGGLVAQHRFGASSWLAPVLFGLTMLGLGLTLGADAIKLLMLIPLAAVGALLLYAGIDL
ncbi:MAG: putative sulfate/molybdate transporter, partial [Candidatus Thiodiazotropha sp.]